MSFDAVSYAMGSVAGTGTVKVQGEITCTDDGEGNITISEESEEVTDNG